MDTQSNTLLLSNEVINFDEDGKCSSHLFERGLWLLLLAASALWWALFLGAGYSMIPPLIETANKNQSALRISLTVKTITKDKSKALKTTQEPSAEKAPDQEKTSINKTPKSETIQKKPVTKIDKPVSSLGLIQEALRGANPTTTFSLPSNSENTSTNIFNSQTIEHLQKQRDINSRLAKRADSLAGMEAAGQQTDIHGQLHVKTAGGCTIRRDESFGDEALWFVVGCEKIPDIKFNYTPKN